MMEEEVKELVKKFLEGIDEDSLRKGEKRSLDRFKTNVGKIGLEFIQESPQIKRKIVKGLKAAGLQLIANIPIVTPIITAFLEVVTSEDLGDKMDRGFKELGEKMDSGFKELGEKMDRGFKELGERMDSGFKELGEKMDKMLSLQEKTISLQEKTISLQEKTLEILDERLPPPSPEGKCPQA